MTLSTPAPFVEPVLTAFFWSADALRSRSVSAVVLTGVLDIPPAPAHVIADWQRDAASLPLEPGDVEALALARTRARWPDLRRCVHAMAHWASALGLAILPDDSNLALMGCRGARYHHDASHYGGAAFCNLFLSDAKDLDLHFPALGLRIPLQRGLALIFDTGQPHAVIRRGHSGFRATDFAGGQECSQFFLTWELAIESAPVAHALGVTFDPDPGTAQRLDEAQVQRGGKRVAVDPESGQFMVFSS